MEDQPQTFLDDVNAIKNGKSLSEVYGPSAGVQPLARGTYSSTPAELPPTGAGKPAQSTDTDAQAKALRGQLELQKRMAQYATNNVYANDEYAPLRAFTTGTNEGYGLNSAQKTLDMTDAQEAAMKRANPIASNLGYISGLIPGLAADYVAPIFSGAVKGAVAPATSALEEGGFQKLLDDPYSTLGGAALGAGLGKLQKSIFGNAPSASEVQQSLGAAARKIGIPYMSEHSLSGPSAFEPINNAMAAKISSLTGQHGLDYAQNALKEFYKYAQRIRDPELLNIADIIKRYHFDPTSFLQNVGSNGMRTFVDEVKGWRPSILADLQKGYAGSLLHGGENLAKSLAEGHGWSKATPEGRSVYNMLMEGSPKLSNGTSLGSLLDNAHHIANYAYSTMGKAADQAQRGFLGPLMSGATRMFTGHYMPGALGDILELAGVRQAADAVSGGTSRAAVAASHANLAAKPSAQALAALSESAKRHFTPQVAGHYQQQIHDAAKGVFGSNVPEPIRKNLPFSLGGDQRWFGYFNEGGRVAYKSGGKVSSGIEPLVQNLMSGYKKAKAAEVATTKPLLQHSDQTIVRALRVAKKAI